MKELSVEEKAKRYDEVIKKAESLYKAAEPMSGCNVIIETFFPELKESEDERIRGAIIYFISHTPTVPKGTIGKETMIAWLEKQGEQKPIPKYEIGDTIYYNSFGKIESMVVANIVNNGDGNPMYEDVDGNGVFEKELIEQKSANKVEPKFKIGDWVIDKSFGTIKQIKEFDNDEKVWFTDGTGTFIEFLNGCRLWTIQDAKDGDVLYTSSTASNEVFIFKELTIEGYIKCYCSYDSEDKYCEGKYHFIGKPTFMTHPATKEQRDLLFQKMKEAGYEWDADKKELKKIVDEEQIKKNLQDNSFRRMFEQKPAYTKEYDFYGAKFIPKFAKGDMIKDKKRGEVSTIEDFSYDTGLYTHTYGQFPITIQDNYELVEQKPANKAEPKFKVGDWIFTEQIDNIVNGPYKIKEVNDDYGYVLDGIRETTLPFTSEHCMRLWTIQDARDGDVLSYRNGQWIFIYKEIITEVTFKYYALLSEKGVTINDSAFSLLQECITPATKEQRDQLEKAMTDAGYTFDLEKKELRKIEQKFAEWSEEDEKMLTSIIAYVNTNTPLIISQINWLKSLKDRVQPKQEWSEEDENRINRLIAYFEDKESFTAEDDIVYANWLKSLRTQNRWKPSKEQMKILTAISGKEFLSEYERGMLCGLYTELKKLKS